MAKETKFGLALILLLSTVFGFVVYKKLDKQKAQAGEKGRVVTAAEKPGPAAEKPGPAEEETQNGESSDSQQQPDPFAENGLPGETVAQQSEPAPSEHGSSVSDQNDPFSETGHETDASPWQTEPAQTSSSKDNTTGQQQPVAQESPQDLQMFLQAASEDEGPDESQQHGTQQDGTQYERSGPSQPTADFGQLDAPSLDDQSDPQPTAQQTSVGEFGFEQETFDRDPSPSADATSRADAAPGEDQDTGGGESFQASPFFSSESTQRATETVEPSPVQQEQHVEQFDRFAQQPSSDSQRSAPRSNEGPHVSGNGDFSGNAAADRSADSRDAVTQQSPQLQPNWDEPAADQRTGTDGASRYGDWRQDQRSPQAGSNTHVVPQEPTHFADQRDVSAQSRHSFGQDGIAEQRQDVFPSRQPAPHGQIGDGQFVPQSSHDGFAEDRPSVYVVQRGDNYWTISKKQYGSPRYFIALSRYNNQRIPDPRQMRPGMKVLIPKTRLLESRYPDLFPKARTVSTGPATGPKQGFFRNPSGEPHYRVGKDDTLTGIAARHLGRSIRWVQIFELNRDRLAVPHSVKIGTVLRLPADASRVRLVRE